MDFLELLQTIGICLGSLALVAIAFLIFMILTLLTPPSDELDELSEEEYMRKNMEGLSPEQISKLMETVVFTEKPPKRKSSSRRKP